MENLLQILSSYIINKGFVQVMLKNVRGITAGNYLTGVVKFSKLKELVSIYLWRNLHSNAFSNLHLHICMHPSYFKTSRFPLLPIGRSLQRGEKMKRCCKIKTGKNESFSKKENF